MTPLEALARKVGVLTHYVDGLNRPVDVPPETLVRVCAALGAEISRPEEAAEALKSWEASGSSGLPPVVVAWDGALPEIPVPSGGRPLAARLHLEDDGLMALASESGAVTAGGPIPFGYHRLVVEHGDRTETATVISSPMVSWRRPSPAGRSWGVGTHLAALRFRRSRSVGDLKDLETVCHWVGARGGDLVTVLPLLPTFNEEPSEPSPYSPVSRLFWSELVLDLGEYHRAVPSPDSLDVRVADAEVRAALLGRTLPASVGVDAELHRYAQFRGAQARLGRNWRAWPEGPRKGRLAPQHIDPMEERFHRTAQILVRRQMGDLLRRLDVDGVRVGLDLAVGVHPDGYDPWSRQGLFAEGMSVGAPPDPGFPSGQDWGFSPVLPDASRGEGHRYIAASIAHQATLAGVLRIDHVMALSRLYWIPHGLSLDEGTYVQYPMDELFAILTLESHRHQCEVIGENLGTVPPEIGQALSRHGIWGMFLAEFEAASPEPRGPAGNEVALIGTHDTPTLAGWIEGVDIEERVRCGLLKEEAAPGEREARAAGAGRLAHYLDQPLEDRQKLLTALLEWLGASDSPLVIPWIEDLWLERGQVNLPGTRSSQRPNWQRPMARLLGEVLGDPAVNTLATLLQAARVKKVPDPGS